MMQTVNTIKELRELLQDRNVKKVGLVPTMGYLHEGHLSLVDEAKKHCDIVVMSIFVNPLQFGPNEDFDRYPRNIERDRTLAKSRGVDLLFVPDINEMYPQPVITTVSVTGITGRLCGKSRPGHFDGVATVVSKLFHIVQPDYAFFGQKDAQQVAVVKRMVEDLNMPVEVVSCPIVREEDGLAMSSRNVYLKPEERAQAKVLYQSLQHARQLINQGETDPAFIQGEIIKLIKTRDRADIDYVEILTYPDLDPPDQIKDNPIIIALAVKFGKTRLIDNVIMDPGKREA